MNDILFRSVRGGVSRQQIQEALLAIGAGDCEVLYIHTGMTFGLPVPRRKELLTALLDILESLKVETMIFPTFTFSFCNHKPFNVQESPTSMGALNEYIRKSGRGVRSSDPLLSVYVLGNPLNLVDNLGSYSIGVDSSYDRLHNCGKQAKFLFFGADMRECFTYTHYMEAIIRVPYRYDREFSGDVINGGISTPTAVWLYTSYANCRLNPKPVVYETMLGRGMLHMRDAGDGSLCCFSEKDGYDVIAELLRNDPLCLTDGTFDPSIKDTTYNPNNEVIESVR